MRRRRNGRRQPAVATPPQILPWFDQHTVARVVFADMRKPLTRPLSDQEYLDYSEEHLAYEIWMLVRASEAARNMTLIAQQPPTTEADVVTANAIIESMVLHLGNLVWFLYPKETRDIDVVAFDFHDNWNAARPPIAPGLSEIRRRAFDETTRLTLKRSADPQDKQWRFDRYVEVVDVLRTFARGANPARLHQRVRTLLGV